MIQEYTWKVNTENFLFSLLFMKCKNCQYLIIEVVGSDPKNEPYKYSCKKEAFLALRTNQNQGVSFIKNDKLYYTESQLNWFLNLHSKRVCFARHDLNTNNLLAIVISIGALLSSILIPIFNKTESLLTPQIKIYIDHRVDSLLLDKLSILKEQIVIPLLELDQINRKEIDSLIRNIEHIPKKIIK
jgi:hypothetical protein